jgi:chromosome segregation ATPase
LKSRINEQKTAKARIPYKNVGEIDSEIARLEKQVDGGMMKLVDERKALQEVSNLKKQRKNFAGLDEAEKGISDVKAQIAEVKKSMNDPEQKALSEKYSKIAGELDEIKKEQDESYKGINSLRDERTKLQAEQSEKWGAMKTIKDKYYQQKKAFADWEYEANKARREKQRQEQEQYQREKRKKVAEQKLEEASGPAYQDEINTAQGLIRYFDPSAMNATTVSESISKFAAQAQRTVEEAGIKGTRLVSKNDKEEEFFMGGTGGKKKKGKKGGASGSPAPGAPDTGKFNLPLGVLEQLAAVKEEPPMSQSEVPEVVKKLQEKVETWKTGQASETQKVSLDLL